MENIKSFIESAKGMSKSPLGIISLFLVLVYAVASVVLTMAKPEFYSHSFHPVILFLSLFPVIVLFVFAYLVAKHHKKLYAPNDFDDQENFFRSLDVPTQIQDSKEGIATSDNFVVTTESSIQDLVNELYEQHVEDGFCVLHESEVLRPRTSPNSGRYRVRVWVESFMPNTKLTDIEMVTYRVWDDFRNSTLSTTSSKSNFDLWLNVYGEFPILAILKLKNGELVKLHRYLDLPGRPPD